MFSGTDITKLLQIKLNVENTKGKTLWYRWSVVKKFQDSKLGEGHIFLSFPVNHSRNRNNTKPFQNPDWWQKNNEIWSISAMFAHSVMFLKQQLGRRWLILVNTGIWLLLQSSPTGWHVLLQRLHHLHMFVLAVSVYCCHRPPQTEKKPVSSHGQMMQFSLFNVWNYSV